MKKDNILTKKAKQCLTCCNFIYIVSFMVLWGFDGYAREVKAPGRAGQAEGRGGGGGGGGTQSRPSQDFMSCEGRQNYELVFVVRGLLSSALLTISESMYALLLPTLSR